MSTFFRHLEDLLGAVERGQHFALTRYGDGERAILEGREIGAGPTNRYWAFRPSLGIGTSALTADLNRAFAYDDPRYYVGISCPCCAPDDHRYYLERLDSARRQTRTTYSNIFANGNWAHLNARLPAVLARSGRTGILVSHWDKEYERARDALPNNDVVVVPVGRAQYDQPISDGAGRATLIGGSPLWYCENRQTAVARFRILARGYDDAIVLVQVGPVSKVLVHQMFMANPRNTYLDVGHGLDGILFADSAMRGYMAGQPSPACADMDVGWDL